MPPRLHLIGNAHIDPAWMWRWPEGMAEVLATFRSALDRIHEHPRFVFSSGSAAFYEFVERVDPAMFEEIVAAAAERRWEILGGFWVEPDTNLTSGEGLARHALLSQRYFRSRFGRAPAVAYNPDAFGHSAGIPQILARSGLSGYVFMRPGPTEADLPRTFEWASADGSRVRAYRIPAGYGADPDSLDRHLADVRSELDADGEDEGLCFYGVGDHGGGPTRSELARLDHRRAAGDPMAYSNLHRYLARRRRVPEVRGELGYHARGAYSANSAIKAALRRTEAAVVEAESAASMATALTGAPYPSTALGQSWQALLRNSFHDVAAGTVIPTAATDALGEMAAARATASRITGESYVTLAWHTAIESLPGDTAVVVFNPHPWANRSPVELEVGAGPGPLALMDGAGGAVPVQEISSEAVALGRRRITFLASLPACGWSVYHLRSAGEAPPTHAVGGTWVMSLDEATGGLSRLALGDRPVIEGPSFYTTVTADTSDTWSHGLAGYGPAEDGFRGVSVEVLEDGPVRRVIRTVTRHGDSTLALRYLLYAGWDRVLVDVVCDWTEHHAIAKLRFCTPMGARVTAEAPYATATRPADGHEYPCGAWLTVEGATGGFALATDAKWSYDARPGSVGIVVARSPMAAHHDPAVAPAGSEPHWLDQGRQRFRVAVSPGASHLAAARMAAELLRPASAVIGSHHPAAPLTAGVAHLEVSAATVGALKRAEDRPGTVVRLHNPAGEPVEARIRFAGRSQRRLLAPSEIATLYLPDDPARPAREVDVIEDDLPPAAPA